MILYAVFEPDSGRVVRTGEASDEEAALLQGGDAYRVSMNCDPDVRPNTHYVRDGAIHAYTAAELQTLNNLPQGFVWKMPERLAIDMRTETERTAQAAAGVLAARQAAYPPMGDQLDALWKIVAALDLSDPHAQEMLTKIASVKTGIPKAEVK